MSPGLASLESQIMRCALILALPVIAAAGAFGIIPPTAAGEAAGAVVLAIGGGVVS